MIIINKIKSTQENVYIINKKLGGKVIIFVNNQKSLFLQNKTKQKKEKRSKACMHLDILFIIYSVVIEQGVVYQLSERSEAPMSELFGDAGPERFDVLSFVNNPESLSFPPPCFLVGASSKQND